VFEVLSGGLRHALLYLGHVSRQRRAYPHGADRVTALNISHRARWRATRSARIKDLNLTSRRWQSGIELKDRTRAIRTADERGAIEAAVTALDQGGHRLRPVRVDIGQAAHAWSRISVQHREVWNIQFGVCMQAHQIRWHQKEAPAPRSISASAAR
jgi:hypothetical protein